MKRWWSGFLAVSLAGIALALCLRSQPVSAGENLLENPGFEDAAVDPWGSLGSFLDVVAAPEPVHSGSWAARQTDSVNDSASALTQNNAVVAGMTYRFAVWAYVQAAGPAARDVWVSVTWNAMPSCGGAQVGATDGAHLDLDTAYVWQELTGTAVAPASAHCASLRLVLEPAPGQDPVVYWDDAFLGQEDPATATPTATGVPVPVSTDTPTLTPTVTPTPTETATATPIPGGVYLNEYLPHPATDDEYVELYNANPYPVAVSGWQIDDGLDGGAFRIPEGVQLSARGFVVFVRNFRLNNDGDTVRLFAPGGSLVDSHSYDGDPGAGVPWSRSPDGGPVWRSDVAPSPGQPNPPPPTATATPTLTPTPRPLSNAVVLNEVMIHPGSDWNGDGVASADDEYIEVFNTGAEAVDLTGWKLDDGREGGGYTLEPGTGIGPRAFLVVVRRFGLNDAGADSARLLWPDGRTVSALLYSGAPGTDIPWARYPDGGSSWRNDLSPSPGRANPPPAPVTPAPTITPTPTKTPTVTPIPTGILVNEFLAAPAGGGEEYVELYNSSLVAVDLTDWRLDDIEGGSNPHRLPAGSSIAAQGYFVLEGGLGFNNDGDTVRLLAPDGAVRDSYSYTSSYSGIPWSRAPDGGAARTDLLPRTPGQSNRPAVLTLSGHLYLGQPPGATMGRRSLYIGLYGGDDPDIPTRWLANAATQSDGSYTLTFDTANALYRFYTLRPAPLADHQWAGAASIFGVVRAPDRIRFGGLGTGAYPGNDFWMAPMPTSTATATPLSTLSPSPTSTRSTTPGTATPTSTATPLSPGLVKLNEVLAAPRLVDFNRDGRVDSADEYVELYNPGDVEVDVGGWQLDDAEGGSRAYVLPAGVALAPHGFLLLFHAQTGVALNNDGDAVRLLAADGQTEIDRFDYTGSQPDAAWSRSVDGGGAWTEDYPPSPGNPNLPASPTLTPTATPTPTATVTVTPALTPTPTVTPLPMVTPSPSMTPTPPASLPAAGLVRLNEVLPAPGRVDFNGDGLVNSSDEYIELYNPQAGAVDVSGWMVDDSEGGSRDYVLPAGTVLAPHGFLLLSHAQTGVALNNDGDSVRLLGPDGLAEVDRFDYGGSHADTAWSRTVDGDGAWTETYPPSPGGPNIAPTPTTTPTATPTPTMTLSPYPTPADGALLLNEVLPAPRDIDWDSDGTADFHDEWVELYNRETTAADLAGWGLSRGPLGADGLPTGFTYRFPAGMRAPAHGFLVIYQRQSHVVLPNPDGDLYLVRPDGRIADSFTWTLSPGYDRSYSRYPDGMGPWGVGDITVGQPNRPFPVPPPELPSRSDVDTDPGLSVGVESIRRAYELALGTRVTVEGQITAPPGLFSERIAYIQDDSAGLRLYLRQGSYPDLHLGDRVRVTGRLSSSYGQRDLTISSPRWLVSLGPGPVLRPRYLRTSLVTAAQEGRLVLVAGRVTGFLSNNFWLDDGSGEVQVTVDQDLPWRRPFFERGSLWAVVGIVARNEGRFRLLPRYSDDITPPPALLPVTGGQP